MTYTGKVQARRPRGRARAAPADRRRRSASGPMDNNAYLLRCRVTGEQILVDAAAEPDALLDADRRRTGWSAIVTTHRHGDHWQALARRGQGHRAPGRSPTRWTLRRSRSRPTSSSRTATGCAFGAIELAAIHLVGHTPGASALVYDDPEGFPHLFTGDWLFPGGAGPHQRPPTTSGPCFMDVSEQGVRRPPGRDLGLSGPRRRHHAGRRAPAPGRVGASAAGEPAGQRCSGGDPSRPGVPSS